MNDVEARDQVKAAARQLLDGYSLEVRLPLDTCFARVCLGAFDGRRVAINPDDARPRERSRDFDAHRAAAAADVKERAARRSACNTFFTTNAAEGVR